MTGGGTNANLSIAETFQGHMNLNPIPSDLFSIAQPQYSNFASLLPISLKANGISAACESSSGVSSSASCFVPAITTANLSSPSIWTLSKSVVKIGDVLNITGKMFVSWTPTYKNSSIYYGLNSSTGPLTDLKGSLNVLNVNLASSIGKTVPCKIVSSSDTVISCNVTGSVPAGVPMKVQVNVPWFGSSLYSPSIPYALVQSALLISKSNPSNGSISGGTKLSIYGQGFGNTDANSRVALTYNSTVSLPCAIINSSVTAITCSTSALSLSMLNSLSSTINNTIYFGIQVDTLFNNGSVAATTARNASFAYSLGITGQVSDISPSSGAIFGGDLVTINGQSLLPVVGDVQVLFDDQPCSVQNVSNSAITCITPSHVSGNVSNITIITGITGKAQIAKNATFQYQLFTSSMNGTSGSFFGGHSVWIKGAGFCPRNLPNCHTSPLFNLTVSMLSSFSSRCNISYSNYTHIQCTTPPNTASWLVQNNGVDARLGPGFAFNPSSLNITAGDFVSFQWAGLPNSSLAAPQIGQIYYSKTSGAPVAAPQNIGFYSSNNNGSGELDLQFDQQGSYAYVNGLYYFKGSINVAPFNYSMSWRQAFASVVVYVNGQIVPFDSPTILSGQATNTQSSTSSLLTASTIGGAYATTTKLLPPFSGQHSTTGLGGLFSTQYRTTSSSDTGIATETLNVTLSSNGSSFPTTTSSSNYFGSNSYSLFSTKIGGLPPLSGNGLISSSATYSYNTINSISYTTVNASVTATTNPSSTVSSSSAPQFQNIGLYYVYQVSKTPAISNVTFSVSNSSGFYYRIDGLNFGSDASVVTVVFGDASCSSAVLYSNTTLFCLFGTQPVAGLYSVILALKTAGQSLPFYYKQVLTVLSSSPKSGSIGGGSQLVIQGSSFPASGGYQSSSFEVS